MPVSVEFTCQGVTEPFPEASVSIDLINASGVVGHHLRPETFGPLLAEIDRLLKPDGTAMLDVGPTLRGKALRRMMAQAGFAFLGHYRCWFADLTGQMVFRRQDH